MNSNRRELARVVNDLSVASGISLTASQQTLAVQIHLCNLNSKTEMESELAAEFDRVFSGQPEEALLYAFQCWREISQYLPTVADILGLLKTWNRNKLELQRMAEQKAEREKLEAARANGEVCDLSDLKAALSQICQMPEAPIASQQQWKSRQERARLATISPGIVLTKVQLMELANPTTPEGVARLEKEREQTRRELERLERLDRQNLDGIYKQQDNA